MESGWGGSQAASSAVQGVGHRSRRRCLLVVCQAVAVTTSADGSDVSNPRRSAVCVYCGSSSGRSPRYASIAADLGHTLATRGVDLVYGGGRIGLMGIVADAVLDGGGRARGVIPRHLVDMETAHSELTSLEIVDSMHERKSKMADLSDGFVVLPGGLGTFDELFEILTWNQLGLIAKPVVFLDVDNDGKKFFDPLFAAFTHMMEEGFVNGSTWSILQRTTSVEAAVSLAIGTAPVIEAKLRVLDVTSKRSLR